MSQDTMSQDTMSQDTMSQDTMSQDTMSQDTMSQDTMSQDTMSQDTMSQDIMSQDTMSQETRVKSHESRATRQEPRVTPPKKTKNTYLIVLTKPSEKCLGERKKKGELNVFDAFLYPRRAVKKNGPSGQ